MSDLHTMGTIGTLGAIATIFAAIAVTILWGLSLQYFADHSRALRGWVLFLMGFVRRGPGEVRALLLSAIYYGLGLLASVLFASVFNLSRSALASVAVSQLVPTILGIVGAISLSNLFVNLGSAAMGGAGPERFAELGEIPWIKGLQALPAGTMPLGAALGAVVEELFFRGVLLRILTDRLHIAPFAAIAIAGALFCLDQLLQVQTPFQAMVIGSGCVAISLAGGLLVMLTGSAVPAILCHASFVIFFMTPHTMTPNPGGSGRQKAAQ